MKKTAILIDGGFFFAKVGFFARKYFKSRDITADNLIDLMWRIVRFHTEIERGKHSGREAQELYRIYYYDSPPRLNEHTLKALRQGNKKWEELTNDDWYYEITQKSVDVKLGMDITILSYEKLVDVIVLIAGDSDFVPAAKQARIKGVDFILNPLKQEISPDLAEHIDGIQSFSIGVGLAEILKCDPDNNPNWWEEYKNKIASKEMRKQNKAKSRKKKKQQNRQ